MAEKSEKDAQFTIRLPQSLKDEVWESAKVQDIDGVVWIRHAIREKLERERNPSRELSDEEFERRVVDIVTKMLNERKMAEGRL